MSELHDRIVKALVVGVLAYDIGDATGDPDIEYARRTAARILEMFAESPDLAVAVMAYATVGRDKDGILDEWNPD
jgi:hypothetical protein